MKRALFITATGILLLCFWVFETLQFKSLLFTMWIFSLALFSRQHRVRLFTLASLSFALVLALMPSREADSSARIQSMFLNRKGERVPMPWLPYLANLVPESELIRLSTLFAKVTPMPVKGRLLREFREIPPWENAFVEAYRKLRNSNQEMRLPSVHAFQWLQQYGFYPELRHVVLILPKKRLKTPAPLIIFLHGYMGNFQFYSQFLSELDEHVVLIPSTPNLSGLWTYSELKFVFEQERTLIPIPIQNLHLLGLSNGGSGLHTALKKQPNLPKSFTFLSTLVPDPFPSGIPPSTSLLLIYGADDGIASNNDKMSKVLSAKGHRLKVERFEHEGHFVLLKRRDEIRQALRHTLR